MGRCSERFYVDIGEICRRFGGGGHSTAASARIAGATGIEIQERLLGLLVSILQQDKLSIESLMNTPVVTVSAYGYSNGILTTLGLPQLTTPVKLF